MRYGTRRFAAGMAGVLLLAGVAAAGPQPGGPAGRVNINTASVEELASLPGIGPSKAEAIVAHRAKGLFSRPEDLREVKGVGDKLFESLKDRITVGDSSAAPAGRGS